MTERAKAKATLESAFGKTLGATLMKKVVNSFVEEDPFNLAGWYDWVTPDPVETEIAGETYQGPPVQVSREPTLEEKAEVFNKTLRRIIIRTHGGRAAFRTRETEKVKSAQIVKAAVDAAEAELA